MAIDPANPPATPDQPSGSRMRDSRDGSAPEAVNRQQDDESAQAQTVADEVLGRAEGGADFPLDDSEKVKSGDETDDVQDLVDRMRQMETSGRIDMGAFRGERNDDAEEGRYGEAAEEE